MIDVGDGRGMVRYYGNGEPIGSEGTSGMEIVDMVAEDDRPAPKPTTHVAAPEAPPVRELPNEELVQAVLANKVVQIRNSASGTDWVDMRNKGFALRQLLMEPPIRGAEFRLRPETEDVWLALWPGGEMTYYTEKSNMPVQPKWWVKVTRERESLRIVGFEHEVSK